jgi:hypothetical protein
MSLADDMRSLTSSAKDLERLREQQQRRSEQEETDRLKREIEEHRDELFAKIAERIREAAARGSNHYDYRYNGESKKGKVEASVIAEAARSHGFTVNYKDERVDHGDSAAPCVVQEYWLEIRWVPEVRTKQW